MSKMTFILSDAKRVAADILSRLGEDKLHAALLFGSAALGSGHDLDILLVLHRNDLSGNDAGILAKTRVAFPNLILDLQMVYDDEIIDTDNFSLNTQGAYFIEVMKRAEVLYGENPFIFLTADRDRVRTDALKKIQHYVFRARQEVIGCAAPIKDSNPDHFRKNIDKIMYDILLADGVTGDLISARDDFVKSFPEIMPGDDLEVLRLPSPPKIDILLPIFERLYVFALSRLGTPARFKPGRGRIEDIVFDVALGSKPVREQVIVLCDGMPSVPGRDELLQRISTLGYTVIYPRYAGTWDSAGSFLSYSPSEDIRKICDALSSGLQTSIGIVTAPNIVLLASSFGGAAAIDAAEHALVSRAVLLSPVVDFPGMKDSLQSLKEYLRSNFPGAYRFSDGDWEKLTQGEIFMADKITSKTAKKLTIFGGAKDPEVLADILREYCRARAMPLTIYDDMPHIGMSKLRGRIWADVFRVIGS